MVNTKYLTLAAVLLLGIGIGIYLFPTDTKRVKKQFRSLSSWVVKEGSEQQLVGAARAKNISTLFADTCQIEIPSRDVSGSYPRDNILPRIMMARSEFETLSLEFYDMTIEFLDDGIALVTTTAKLQGTTTSGDQLDEIHELDCTLQKIQDVWLFTKVKMVEVLKK